MPDIFELLKLAQSSGASDVHLVVDTPPMFRIHGALKPADNMAPLTAHDLETMFEQIIPAKEKTIFRDKWELDFGYGIPGVGRFRLNVARQRGTLSFAIRTLPLTIPTIDQLELPEICKELITKPRGFVIVTGPTGSGKSTTLAAMIDHLNHTEYRRIVTIEDPIEYVYTNHLCTITQRELGSDTQSFAAALRHVLRQNPDVILVGEMRDAETASSALTLAETGHLVLTTGHAPSTSQAIERILGLFPPHERHLAQAQLASLIVGVLCQVLVPRASGSGRIAAVEIMLANPAVRNLIREDKIYQLPNTIRTNTKAGMQLLDQALVNLYLKKQISRDSVFTFCNDAEEVTRLIGSNAVP
jgi:twitching motility protein PilT